MRETLSQSLAADERPLSDEDCRLIAEARKISARVVVVLTKVDLLNHDELSEMTTLFTVLCLQVSWTLFEFYRAWRRPNLFEQSVQIEPSSEHRQLALRRPGPRFLGAVPIQFHAVVVGVTQVECLADPVIAGPIKLNSRFKNSPQGSRERLPIWVEDGGVVQARGPWWR